MEPVNLTLPSGARVLFNSLYQSNDPDLLTQSILAVKLADGSVIDVSWFPEYDPAGAYTITWFQGSWDNQKEVIESPDIDRVVREVQRMARQTGVTGQASWSDEIRIGSPFTSASTSTTHLAEPMYA
jgi:hypothetical protein